MDVDKRDAVCDLSARRRVFLTRVQDNKRDTGSFLPESKLSKMPFFSHAIAVVRPQDNDGIVGVRTCLECIDQAANKIKINNFIFISRSLEIRLLQLRRRR